MGIAKVTRNYQVTIPRDVRVVQDINIGDTVFFSIEGGRIDFFKMKRESLLKETAGIWNGLIKEDSVQYVTKTRQSWKKRAQRVKL
ncbi:AbrB/MazE/SpoVT family DNA-binding domain-containing protein [Candidatus Woesearchaeota archaeon]|nr:AbrB/MazE/SpoVT family DNA-binding domain-containing protein [Candidatus Woesearchaeota archaeon]